MGQRIPVPTNDSKLKDQRISSLCTLVSYSNLALVVTAWHTTMDDLSQPMTKMMTGVICALSASDGKGGGWWFGVCCYSVLTSPHPNIFWYCNTATATIKYVEMKVCLKHGAI